MGNLCQWFSVRTDDHCMDSRTVPDAGTASGEPEEDRAEYQSDRDSDRAGIFPV